MAVMTDLDNARLIAEILVKDLSFFEDQAAAEGSPTTQVAAGSEDEVMEQPAKTRSDTLNAPSADFLLALRCLVNDTMAVADAAYVQSTHNVSDAAMIRDYQTALKIAAEERRANLDHAFAIRLQAMHNAGRPNIDMERMRDANQVLGVDAIESLLAENLNNKGKGKYTGKSKSPFLYSNPTSTFPSGLFKCGICHEPFLITKNPYRAAQTPNSSNRVSFGQVLPCPGTHGYCIDCMTSYLRTKLEDGGADRQVFPIRCPECPPTAWQMDDDTAKSVLSPDLLNSWHHYRRLHGLTKLLPDDERSPEDRAVLELARKEHWRRCPACHVIVELTQGTRAVACKHEFCHRCGSDWKGKCTRSPTCVLWDDEMLLEERERDRAVPRQEDTMVPVIEGEPRLLFNTSSLNWIGGPGVTQYSDGFTANMLNRFS
ncbi:hypothetical protein FRB98_005746, partial [Tulasnella sp. 332]